MTRAEKIEQRLQEAFQPRVLEVVDDSERHRGHGGYQDGGQSHFNVTIAADGFAGMSRIARHRAVHAALGRDLVAEIHALALTISD
ncbi:BolA family protein [Roseicyclus mahoneyensis]|uniref:BolA protein family transcriptional regulator n=1 Tax=Roseicyclus mahoneyensis TaxID=164332 RepID=A0A316GN81_9RHOB|nr:BolA family protein [Roseicyclus mahoneyensis]PWK62088.1 BolA protein family transcriptional regulator [Roseicyclus mahoneyensis]